MNYKFIKDFLQLCKDVADIKASIAAMATQSDDRAAMKAMTPDIGAHGKALQDAVSGTPPAV